MAAIGSNQGPIDHPSYLTRQQISMPTYAGSAASTNFAFGASNMRIRTVSVVVNKAGTATDTMLFKNGTSSIGQLVLGTQATGTMFAVADLNATITAPSYFNVTNGADTVRTCGVTLEAYLDPQATWTGVN